MQITLNNYEKLLSQIQKTIAQTEKNVNREKVAMSWQIGKVIEQHLVKNERAGYGEKLFEQLVKDTSIKKSALYQMHSFYKSYPTLPKSDLSWTHYRILSSVETGTRRKLLEELTIKNNLNAETLQRKVSKSKKSPPKKPTKLTVKRGQVFTYKITTEEILKQVQDGLASASGSSSTIYVDCGFNIFTRIKTTLSSAGEIMESVKKGDGFALKKSKRTEKELHTYKAYLNRVVDGDTLHVTLDLGFGIEHREILRLAKINAPEIATTEGKKSSDALKEILKDVPFLVLRTNKTDIYGRYVADVFFDEKKLEQDVDKVAANGTYLGQLLLDLGLVAAV